MIERIRSIMILKKIFENIKGKQKLKILKYNKKMKLKLNIKLKDYSDYLLLKELNQKYNLNIKDLDIKDLKLDNKENIDEIFEYINKLEFKELKKLDLSEIGIKDIQILEKFTFFNAFIFDILF